MIRRGLKINADIVNYYVSEKSASIEKTSKKFNCSQSFVVKTLKENNINKETLGYYKNQHKKNKTITFVLTDEIKEIIKSTKDSGTYSNNKIFSNAVINFYQDNEKLSLAECGKIFGVSQSTISRIIRQNGLKAKTLSELKFSCLYLVEVYPSTHWSSH